MSLIRFAVLALLVLVALALLAGAGLRLWDKRGDATLAARLLALRPVAPQTFDPESLGDLPEPARRYLTRAIAPGTPLSPVVTLQMQGSFRLNGQALPMTASQTLAPQAGFVWQARIGQGAQVILGSDGLHDATGTQPESWTRFAILGLVPVVRAGRTADHRRSAGTRALMEAIWAPAALLPQAGAHWRQSGPDSAEVSFPARPDVAPMEMTLDPTGLPLAVTAQRWSDANPDRRFRLQPFGGTFAAWESFGGFTIPVAVEMGNHYGTPDYDRFFSATITEAQY